MNQFFVLAMTLSCACMVGCQSAQFAPLAPNMGQQLPARTQGTLGVSVLWPKRTIQLIPLSTQTILLQVKKDGILVQEFPLSRPVDDGSPLVAHASLLLDAGTGYTVEAAAYRDETVSAESVPLASANSGPVTVVANQRTPVVLSLGDYFVPVLEGFTPTNGGPGVEVTLQGSFGDSGYYGMSIGGARTSALAGATDSITASVPDAAVTGPVFAWADGASASLGATFSVLSSLTVTPAAQTTTLSATSSYALTTGTDTTGQTINNPTITHWEVVDPVDLNATSSVGTIDASGVFTATQAGTASVRAWSGNLQATATVTVN